jgi:hypothetical protein
MLLNQGSWIETDQQQLLDNMSLAQKQALVKLVDERLNGDAGKR